jgi:hypothetical protein
MIEALDLGLQLEDFVLPAVDLKLLLIQEFFQV